MTMKQLNNRGIALLTALMMTVIMLSIILGVMYLIDRTIKGSAAHKTYRNAVEASYGGADLVAREIIPQLFNNVTISDLITSLDYIKPTFASSACLQQKLNFAPETWGTIAPECNSVVKPSINPDVSFELKGSNGQAFTVHTKIVDTTPGVPYSTGGSQLVGGGVAESSAGSTLKLDHYVYRIEVSAEESKAKSAEKSNVSVLYEY